eukprot:Nitzschia sp. Nitz4//scaffold12_size214221//122547//124958//NITZ4_001507-RA/size214221-processed-gene-0.354-mRNA-1//-1//CDS//3329535041//4519//frame0
MVADGRNKATRPKGLRLNACGPFQSIFLILVLVWFVYLFGVLYMILGVRRQDPLLAPIDSNGFNASVLSRELAAFQDRLSSPVNLHPQIRIPRESPPKTRMREGAVGNPKQHENVDATTRSTSSPESPQKKKHILTAFLEPIDQSTWDTKPLPRRTTTSDDLTQVPFPQLQSCSKLTEQWPVDNYPDDDPFLPWIHDAFPTADGKYLQFIAQNKRRCHTGHSESEERILTQMAPQVALFQHVPLKRIENSSNTEPRYRLSSHEEADPESMATRFLCRFKPSGDVTFSTFNNEYEYTAFRKGQKQMFNSDGRDNKVVQTSQFIFQCPIPDHLVELVRDGTSVQNDWATLFVDLIPVRTPPRYGPPGEFLVPHYREGLPPNLLEKVGTFDAMDAWGRDHVLPALDDSGRWANIPICKPSLMTYHPDAMKKETLVKSLPQEQYPRIDRNLQTSGEVKHRLIGCLWASSGYATRGERYAINDGQRRLAEWITFNKLLGFDHFYVYDNSGAFTNTTSLEPITRMFPDDITYIKWPCKVCNNHRNGADSPGHRSSQYAAESSCRLRFGPHTDWIGQFDIDEYLIPMGNFSSVLPLLDKLDHDGTKAISFASWRAWPRMSHINEPQILEGKDECSSNGKPCFELSIRNDTTMLEGYNCDRVKPGHKSKSLQAEKQLYRADYVTQHFIHYSTITKATHLHYQDFVDRFGTSRVFPDPLVRFADEVNEALMLHSKAVARQDTAGWVQNCHSNYTDKTDSCRLGFAWPPGEDSKKNVRPHDDNGWNYNCFAHEHVDSYWGPKLRSKLQERGFL